MNAADQQPKKDLGAWLFIIALGLFVAWLLLTGCSRAGAEAAEQKTKLAQSSERLELTEGLSVECSLACLTICHHEYMTRDDRKNCIFWCGELFRDAELEPYECSLAMLPGP